MFVKRLADIGRMARHPLVAGIAGLGLLVGAATAYGLLHAIAGVSADDPLTERPADAGVTYISEFSDGSHAFALLWRGDDQLWYVRSPADGALALARYRVSTGKTTEWPLPMKATQTFHTYLTQDASGTLWIAANYTVAAFDPASETFVAALGLGRDVQDAQTDGSGATWVNGLSVGADGRPMLTRNGVFAVYEPRPGGMALTETLDAPPSGLKIFDGQAIPYRQESDSSRLLGSRAHGEVVAFFDVGRGRCRFEQQNGALMVLSEQGSVLGADLVVPPQTPSVISPQSGQAAIYLPLAGSIVEFDCARGVVTEHRLEVTGQLPDGLAPAGRSAGSQGPAAVEMPDAVEALALSPNGSLAAALASNRVAIIR